MKFTKMHGLGNDFIVIDAVTQNIRLKRGDIRRLSDRHKGVGFDQCLIIEAASQSDIDFNYRIFNADGGEVGQCGNGARCLAKFIQQKKLSNKDHFIVATHNTKMTLRLINDGMIAVNMGVPLFTPQLIPMTLSEELSDYPLTIKGEHYRLHALSMGNPHAILLVDDIDTAKVDTVGQTLTTHPLFPQGANINFMQVINLQHIRLRVFERGVGETLACGSGACASVVAGIRYHKLANNVRVDLPGGQLEVRWQGLDTPVELVGPAETVFEGELDL